MRKIIVCFILSLVAMVVLGGVAYYTYQHPQDLKANVSIADSSYDSTNDQTTLSIDVTIKNDYYSYGLTATDFSYIICFKGKKDLTLHEVLVEPDAFIAEEDYKVTLSFEVDGDYDVISGEVKKAEIRVVDVNYVNATRHRLDNGGEKYDTELRWLILFCFLSFLSAFSCILTIASDSDGGFFKTIFQYIFIAVLAGGAFSLFLFGPMKFIVAYLA